jgi:uncharacterized membrane protein YccC
VFFAAGVFLAAGFAFLSVAFIVLPAPAVLPDFVTLVILVAFAIIVPLFPYLLVGHSA